MMRVYSLICSIVLSLVVFQGPAFAVTNLSSKELHKPVAMPLPARSYPQSKASCPQIPFEEGLRKFLRQTLKYRYDDAFKLKPLASSAGRVQDKKKQTGGLEIGYRILFPLENY